MIHKYESMQVKQAEKLMGSFQLLLGEMTAPIESKKQIASSQDRSSRLKRWKEIKQYKEVRGWHKEEHTIYISS